MTYYFPEPYKDEILYSIFARYHYYMGNKSTKQSLKEIYGIGTIIPTVELPTNLKCIKKSIGENSKYNVEYFINKHTNLPFYLPFLRKEDGAAIKDLMVNNDGKGIYTKIGIVAGGVCTKKELYYCPKCASIESNDFGEAYFHRIHQVPGVLVCPMHFCMLKQYVISKRDIGRINFIKLELKHVDYTLTYFNKSITSSYLIKIAKCADYILQNDLSKFNSLVNTEKYKLILEQKGLLTYKKRVRQNKLIEAFRSYYPDKLLEILESNFSNKDSSWIRMITRKSKHMIHPIRHILFILFLYDDFKEFFKEDHINMSFFEKSLWPCLNPACINYRSLVIENCNITYDYKIKELIGTFKCECGFIYSRKISENLSDKYKVGKVKYYGEVWSRKLIQLINSRKYSIREMGRVLKCDSKTIVKYARELGYGEILSSKMVISKNKKSLKKVDYRENYSRDIVQVLTENPQYTTSQVRSLLKRQYAWFYRNDREWLRSILARNRNEKNKSYSINRRVDWKDRDEEIYHMINKEYKKLFKEEVRITKSIIGNKLGILALLEYYLDRLPKTRKYLSEIVETVEEFQIRRIHKVCKSMIEKDIELKRWKILKKAGLMNCNLRIEETINQYLNL